MIATLRILPRRWLVLGFGLLIGGTTLLSAFPLFNRGASKPRPRLDHWDTSRLIAYLNDRGLSLRPVSSSENGDLNHGVFLTRTSMSFEQLNSLHRVCEQIDQWRGTVYCQPYLDPHHMDLQIAMWGDCCLTVPPFLFFGDQELLAAIRQELNTGGDVATQK